MSNPFQPWRTFKPDETNTPHGWIQWKGTNVCMDVHCACGEMAHVDAEHAYYVRCGGCGRVYELSGHVEIRELALGEVAALNVVNAEVCE